MPDWPSNPFSTRFVAPGQLNFVGLDDQALDDLAEKLIQQNGNGQIIGPHGTGKTTLTFELQKRIDRLNDKNTNYRFVRKTIGPRRTIRTGKRVAGLNDGDEQVFRQTQTPRSKTILVLDGIELLSWLQRLALIKTCLRKQIGLLVTSHRSIWGLPVLASTQPDRSQLEAIVHQLTRDCDFQISADRLEELYTNNNGNIREALMSCYDEFEASRAKTDC